MLHSQLFWAHQVLMMRVQSWGQYWAFQCQLNGQCAPPRQTPLLRGLLRLLNHALR